MNDDEKKGLQMYPGVSLGSAPKKRGSNIKLIILILLIVIGASAGGYWINSKFLSPAQETDITDITDITITKSVASSDAETTTEPANPIEDDILEDINLDTIPAISEDSTETTKTIEKQDTTSGDILDGIDFEESTPEIPVTEEQPVTETIAAETSIENTPTEIETTATEPVEETIESSAIPVSSMSITDALKESDSMIAQGKYKDSEAILNNLLNLPENEIGSLAPDLYYRTGLTYRYLKNEEEAQKNWLKAYQNFPDKISGRLAALALADTWYYWYVQSTQNYKQWEAIRDAYSTAIGMDGARFLPQSTTDIIAKKLNLLNEKLVFDSTMPVAGAIFHTVEPGEYISTIANEYGLGTWSSIVDINKVNPKNLKVGMKLKIMPGRLFILVDKRNFTLSWYLDGKFIKRYGCATGTVDSETPVGHYEIFKMDAEPNWTDPNTGKVYKYGEEGHAIGSRWLAIRGGSKTGLGIHGTIAPESIGTKASNGCIRLLNKDVEELYGFANISHNNESEVLVIE